MLFRRNTLYSTRGAELPWRPLYHCNLIRMTRHSDIFFLCGHNPMPCLYLLKSVQLVLWKHSFVRAGFFDKFFICFSKIRVVPRRPRFDIDWQPLFRLLYFYPIFLQPLYIFIGPVVSRNQTMYTSHCGIRKSWQGF